MTFIHNDVLADLCKGLYILASGSVRAGMINDEGKEPVSYTHLDVYKRQSLPDYVLLYWSTNE